jgi:hypothetical protein
MGSDAIEELVCRASSILAEILSAAVLSNSHMSPEISLFVKKHDIIEL